MSTLCGQNTLQTEAKAALTLMMVALELADALIAASCNFISNQIIQPSNLINFSKSILLVF
ncbi:Hypothetical protein FKW44_005379, partial [Caligus rogercresseyi]